MPSPATFVFHDGTWTEGNKLVAGPMHHAFWLGSVVFDGARAFEGMAPDLDQHAARAVRSARAMGLSPTVSPERIHELMLDGIRRHTPGAALYIRPMFWAEAAGGPIQPDPDSTQFLLAVYESPLPGITGLSATLSPYRRPAPDSAPTDAKASCLYPNGARAMRDAMARGFTNAVLLDQHGQVAEFATSNLFFVKDGVVHTPALNGSFLAGVTRSRVISLLRADGVTVLERSIRPEELDHADEIFSTGNYGKVQPLTRWEGRALQPGPIYRTAREAYWQYASDTAKV
jgi:branched-chain amino acid aminotransferase